MKPKHFDYDVNYRGLKPLASSFIDGTPVPSSEALLPVVPTVAFIKIFFDAFKCSLSSHP